jgi:MFS family permease
LRAELRDADARWEVARAARAWSEAGVIDEPTRAVIAERYADDRRRSKPAFRALFLLFTLLAGLALWWFGAIVLGFQPLRHSDALASAALLLVFAAGAALGAEAATAIGRLRRHGVEEGLVALALLLGAGGVAQALDAAEIARRPLLTILAISVAAAAAAAAWRWGTPGCGAISAAGLFGALYLAPGARGLWIAAGTLVAVVGHRWAALPRAAVAHRRRVEEAAVVAVGALYAAVHAAGLRSDLFGVFDRTSALTRSVAPAATALAWAAMFALPVALLVAGVGRRERLPLALGGLLLAASSASAADALDLRPAWLVLLAAGAIAFGAALALRRLFSGVPGRIAGGFTDGPLYDMEGRRSWLEIAGALAVLTPEPRSEPPEPEFRAGGGGFGGGGASGEF